MLWQRQPWPGQRHWACSFICAVGAEKIFRVKKEVSAHCLKILQKREINKKEGIPSFLFIAAATDNRRPPALCDRVRMVQTFRLSLDCLTTVLLHVLQSGALPIHFKRKSVQTF